MLCSGKVRTILLIFVGIFLGVSFPWIISKFCCGKENVVKLNVQNGNENKLENLTLADKLFKEVRVLCWIMTSPENHQNKAVHTRNTWGKRCNKFLIMSSQNNGKSNYF